MSLHRPFPIATGACALALLLALVSPARAADTRAFACTSDFTPGAPGSVSVADLVTHTVSLDVASIHNDAVARWFGGLLHVVNRFGGDNIQVIDPAANYATVRQISTGNGSNPQDIAFVSPTKAYVSRYGSSDLLILNPSHPLGLPQSSISLAAFADGDGLPEMARMIRIGRYLFVACQRLTGFVPSNPSMVVVVDTQTDLVVDVDPVTPGVQAITLATRNPVTSFDYDRGQGRLLIGCGGNFGVLDGAVEAVDPVAFASLGVVTTEAELGGDLNDVIWHTATHAYALVGTGTVNRLVTWNPTNGLKTGTPFTANGGFSLPDMEINDRGELYVCKNPNPPSASDLPGLLVFSVATDGLLAGPLGTGLPPIAVTFDHATDQVTGVPPELYAELVFAPRPNPTRQGATFGIRLERASELHLDVYDVGGRHIRALARGPHPAGTTQIFWDLKGDDGRRVASGVYLARTRMGHMTTMRRLSVLR